MKNQYKRIIVTAALPYANGKIHLGHLAGAYLPADIYVRYQRLMKRDVVFICGSDEHGVPITITADQEKTTPQVVVDRYHTMNQRAFEKFGMSFDHYSRTSLPLHHTTASDFFKKLYNAGVLKEKKEKQLFDEKANMFLPDRYVEGTCPVCQYFQARGDQCEQCGTFLNPLELIDPKSKITGNRPTVRETSHWYFPLGDYQERLKAYIQERHTQDGWKENVLRYCESWFKEGLTDRAVTRDLQWGVKVPLQGYENKVLYVWFDAVLGYISGTKEWSSLSGNPEQWKKYWLDEETKYVAFIGKDNVVFHCIVFPAMLMAWNDNSVEKYILPQNVPANEFLNFEGQKFSKSRGWGIDVDEFLADFPADTLRYALTMNLPELRDTDFYWSDFQARTNNELADIFGNFVHRTLTFIHNNFSGRVPEPTQSLPIDKELVARLQSVTSEASNFFEMYRFREGALEIMNLARFANKYFNDSEPWKTLKQDPRRCATTLFYCVQIIRSLAILFEPILPFTALRMWKMLNLQGTPQEIGWMNARELVIKSNQILGKPEILFNKIDDQIIEKRKQQLPSTMSSSVTQLDAIKPIISLDDFQKVDLRVAKIIQAERIPKSEKLLRIQVSIGNEQRQIVAGIAQHYSPEALVGKSIVIAANLKSAKLMGVESQGMLLAASNSNGKLVIVTTEGDIDEGSIVK
ncbi:MAG TPA: methionine--tRNA ligase [Bacteroidota bacterium]|nr:methionine--tRNA ligase [Bacteroidota bacterium]